MAEPASCPSRDELQRMVLGKLPDHAAQRIQLHLEQCPNCCSVLDQCVASDQFLAALRSSRRINAEPTKTLHLPIQCLRGALSTWSQGYARTESGKGGRPFSMAEINRLLSPPESADEIGRIGDFRVIRVLGSGGFAVVFEAEDPRLKRRVALKMLHPAIASIDGAERFLREAQSAAALKDEHVVTIYQVGTQGEMPFIAMELLQGETLEERLAREGRLSIREAVRIGREIASGLSAAHERGLLHRDIKPANIWLERAEAPLPAEPVHAARQPSRSASSPGRAGGTVKILDFGCAKSWADEVGLTGHGAVIGTPGYMAPEQFFGDAVDPRTDLFSLGCVLYRMAAGRRPFGGDNVFSVVRALALEVPAPLQAASPKVPRSLSDLVDRLLSKTLDGRPATAKAVVLQLREIEKALEHQRVTGAAAVSESAGSRAPRRLYQKPAIAVGLCLAVLIPLVYFAFGAQLIRIATNQGEIVIEVDDPNVTVKVHENHVAIHDGQGQAAITLAAGEHQLDVTLQQPTGEATFRTDKFVLRRGGKKVFEAREELAKAVASLTPTVPNSPVAKSPGPKSPVSNSPVSNSQAAKPPENRAVAATTIPLREAAASDFDRTVASWVLAQGGSVTIEAGQPPHHIQVSPGTALPSSSLKLKTVDLQQRTPTDADLAHFRGLKQLTELRLGGSRIKGPGLANLSELTQLKSLVLWNTAVTDAPLKDLEGLTRLNRLWLDGAPVTDAGLTHIKPLTNLRELNLNWAPVTGSGLKQLGDLPHLEVLYLRGHALTDANAIHLRGLKSLQTLLLSEQPLSDAGLVHIRDLNQLQVLAINSTKLTDATIAQLRSLKNLRELDLSWTHVTDAGLKQLEDELPQLESLYLRGRHLSDAGLVHLRGFKRLKTLYLSGQPVTNAGLAEVVSLKQLESLGLSSTQVTDAGLGSLAPLKNLHFLNLDQTSVTDAGLAHLQKLPQLQTLTLVATHVSDKGLAALQGVKRLHVLVLKGATQIGDAAIPAIARLRGLTEINLSGTRVTTAGVATLKASLPQCQIRMGASTETARP